MKSEDQYLKFVLWNDEDGLGPVEVERHRVRIVPDGLLDFFVRECIDGSPISFPPSGVVPRDPRNIFVFRLCALAVLR